MSDDSNLAEIANNMIWLASRGAFNGELTPRNQAYINSCTHIAYGTKLIFTRDTGHHSSGWFKNPDYERCLHLSLSPAPRHLWTPSTPDLDAKLKKRWLRVFFGDALRHAWFESAKTSEGKSLAVEHWRVFCDPAWRPITPRKEVYSKDFIEKGWRSASELGVLIETAEGMNPS